MINPALTIVESLQNGTISYEKALSNLELFREGANDTFQALATQMKETAAQRDDMTERIIELKEIRSLSPDTSWCWQDFSLSPAPQNAFWGKHFTFHMVGYFFSIVLRERKYVKRTRFQVDVMAEKTHLLNGQADRHYGAKRYGFDALHQKFATLDEAISFVSHWQEQLITDHEDIRAWQESVYNASRKDGVDA